MNHNKPNSWLPYKKEQLDNDLSFGDIDVHTYHMLDYDCELEISKSPKNEEEIKQLYVLKKLENMSAKKIQ